MWVGQLSKFILTSLPGNKTCSASFSLFSGAKSALAGNPLINAWWKQTHFFTNHAYFTPLLLSDHSVFLVENCIYIYLCGIHYQWLWPNCCKCNSLGDIDAINWDNACRGPNRTSAWPRNLHQPSIHRGYSSVRWWSPAARASPIGSNQEWRLHCVGSLPIIQLLSLCRFRGKPRLVAWSTYVLSFFDKHVFGGCLPPFHKHAS